MNGDNGRFDRKSGTLYRTLIPWGFPLIYIGWAYLFWAPVFLSDTSIWSFPKVLFFLLGGISPFVAGVTMAYVTGGPERVRGLWVRLIDIGRISPKWWAIIVGFWVGFDLVMSGLAIFLDVTASPVNVVWDQLTDPGTLGFFVVLSFIVPIVEEIGLRGYYLDQLQERYSTTVAGLLNGLTWVVWHTPFLWFPGYYEGLSFSPEFWWWLPSIVFQTLLIVWVYNNTRRSILAVLIFHGMMNFTGLVLGLAPEIHQLSLLGTGIVALVLVVHWRRSARSIPGVAS